MIDLSFARTGSSTIISQVSSAVLIIPVLLFSAGTLGTAQQNILAVRAELSPMAQDLQGLDLPSSLFKVPEGENSEIPGRVIIRYYRNGPWKGGKAVVECARDLSYAEIRIYNKDNDLVRIYSRKAHMQNLERRPPLAEAAPSAEVPVPPQRANTVESGAGLSSPPQRSATGSSEMASPLQNERNPAPEVAKSPSVVTIPHGQFVTVSELKDSDNAEPAPPPQAASTVLPPSPSTNASSPNPATLAPSPTLVGAGQGAQGKNPAKQSVNNLNPVAVVPPALPARAASKPSVVPEPVLSGGVENRSVASAQNLAVPAPSAGFARSEAGRGSPPQQNAAAKSSPPEPAQVASAVPESKAPLPKTEAMTAPFQEVAPLPTKDEQLKETVQEAQQAQAQSTLDSDAWTPQPVPPPAAEREPVAVSAARQTPAKRRAQAAEKPLSEAEQMQRAVQLAKRTSLESDSWSPKPVRLQAEKEPDFSFLEKIKPPTQKPAIKQDIGNPEEGVLPVNSFDKFDGPMYGRHREFERRVIYTHNRRSPVKGYDFYVDEVNRKEEYHHLYYYKFDKHQKPKLIAVEKHDHVTFLSNYDVGREGKGKITTY